MGDSAMLNRRPARLAMAPNFSQNFEKVANLSVLMAKVMSMEIVVDES
jgi:hypothetical protein